MALCHIITERAFAKDVVSSQLSSADVNTIQTRVGDVIVAEQNRVCNQPRRGKLHTLRGYNAALNIARSDKVVTKKEQCAYYKQTQAAQ